MRNVSTQRHEHLEPHKVLLLSLRCNLVQLQQHLLRVPRLLQQVPVQVQVLQLVRESVRVQGLRAVLRRP
jgi:hypothetical protein